MSGILIKTSSVIQWKKNWGIRAVKGHWEGIVWFTASLGNFWNEEKGYEWFGRIRSKYLR